MKVKLTPEVVYSVTTPSGALLGVFTVKRTLDDVLELETNTGRLMTVLLDEMGPLSAAFGDIFGKPRQAQVLRLDPALHTIIQAAEPEPKPDELAAPVMTVQRAAELVAEVARKHPDTMITRDRDKPREWIVEAVLAAAAEGACTAFTRLRP